MTRNNADFHGIDFSHLIRDDGAILISANHPEHGRVGTLELEPEWSPSVPKRQVRSLLVKKDFRRKGVATGLWNYAERAGLNPEHSPQRTKEGDLWAKSLGTPLPKLTRENYPYGQE